MKREELEAIINDERSTDLSKVVAESALKDLIIKELNEIIIAKDMAGAELHNENKELKQKLETRIAMWEHEKQLRRILLTIGKRHKNAQNLMEDCYKRIHSLLSKQPKWISVKDELPKEDDEILFTDGKFVYKGCWTTWDGGCSDFSYVVGSGFANEVNDESFTEEQITHWMPLPPPPTTDESFKIKEGM